MTPNASIVNPNRLLSQMQEHSVQIAVPLQRGRRYTFYARQFAGASRIRLLHGICGIYSLILSIQRKESFLVEKKINP